MMSEPTTLVITEAEMRIRKFMQALNDLEDKGFGITQVPPGMVRVGDYLIEGRSPDGSSRYDLAMVIATRSEQGSGPRPDRHYVAIKGERHILHLDRDHYLVLTRNSND